MKRLQHRPLEGQLSLIGDPPVQYCGGCGRMLKDHRSRKRGFGPRCWQLQQGRIVLQLTCRDCGESLMRNEPCCPGCGAGIDRPLRVRKTYIPANEKEEAPS